VPAVLATHVGRGVAYAGIARRFPPHTPAHAVLGPSQVQCAVRVERPPLGHVRQHGARRSQCRRRADHGGGRHRGSPCSMNRCSAQWPPVFEAPISLDVVAVCDNGHREGSSPTPTLSTSPPRQIPVLPSLWRWPSPRPEARSPGRPPSTSPLTVVCPGHRGVHVDPDAHPVHAVGWQTPRPRRIEVHLTLLAPENGESILDGR
jgi:hypothetical protein